ncbi:hypothetical protein [Candidatus Nitrotoga arctica]|uniref:Uncharacterized protein n=1 Tax=Candidatus Nitrotoga arctica TaxID=453162 RepID=A0ABM8YY32_9PROT|nr:hypothetical protein [Candidatus Nitrotoga arctica]CAG9932442.1 conserved protein of unknown function [Candidatus Nitrotoga arctica]
MDKKQLPARLPSMLSYTVEPKHLRMQYVNDENPQGKFDWDVDDPFVMVIREYLRYIAYKSFR